MGKSRTNKEKKRDSTIISAVITVSGTIIVALITVFGPSLFKSSQALPTITNTVAPTEILTATNTIIPTEIYTSTPTITSTPTPKTYSEIASKWWDIGGYTDNESEESKTIVDGTLHWQVKTKGTYRFNLRSYLPTTLNFDFEATLNLKDVPYQVEYGVFFRLAEPVYYVFLIDNQGRFTLQRRENSKTTELLAWQGTSDNAINSSGKNILRVKAIDNDIELYANGNLLGTYSADNKYSVGSIGIQASLDSGETIDLDITQYELKIYK